MFGFSWGGRWTCFVGLTCLSMWWARKTTSTPVMDFFALQSLTSKVFFSSIYFVELLKEDIFSLLDSRRMFCGCNFWIIWNDLVVESSQRFYHGNGYFPGNKSISPSSQCGVGMFSRSLEGRVWRSLSVPGWTGCEHFERSRRKVLLASWECEIVGWKPCSSGSDVDV